MRNDRASFGVAVAAIVAIVGGSVAFQPDPAPKKDPTQVRQPSDLPRRNPGEGRGENGPPRAFNLEGAMKQMNRSMKQLSEQITDPSRLDENLRLINDMQRGCAAAKGLGVPRDMLEKAKTPEEKTKLVSEFRKDLIAVMRSLLEIEESMIDGKSAYAKAKLDTIIDARDKAHKALGVKDEK
jgi:hypothetical protein